MQSDYAIMNTGYKDKRVSQAMRKNILFILSIIFLSNCAQQRTDDNHLDTGLPLEKRVEALLGKMTLEEKVAQLSSYNRSQLSAANEGAAKSSMKLKEAIKNGIGFIENVSDPNPPAVSVKNINELQKYIIENTRLGIPAMIGAECLHGHRGFNSTSFPVPIAMACSWNPDLINKAYDIVGREARLRGASEAHTPVLDLGRDPRWGRIEETFGEDAYLASKMAVASVSGLQGGTDGNPGSTHIISSSKHFAGYGQIDGGRNFAPTYITPRIFKDEILKPFEAAIKEASALGIMASHCEIDGVPAHGNKWLLSDLLRDELGFKGIVVSDYYDIKRLHEFHHVAATVPEAAEMALIAGVDVDLAAGTAYKHLVKLIEEKPALGKYLDRGVRRVLAMKFKLGLFENPYANMEAAEKLVGSDEHQAIAKKVADESLVLLKNEKGLLPLNLSKLSKIAVIGPKANSKSLGTYSSSNDYTVSMLDGIKKAVGNKVKVIYEKGCKIADAEKIDGVKKAIEAPLKDEMASINKAVSAARSSDVAVVCIGSETPFSMEAFYMKGYTGDRATLDLLGNQMELVNRVVATGTPTVVVLMHGRPLTIPELAKKVPAIIDVFYLGQAVGSSVADALFGKVNPSGKLSISYPESVGQIPIYYSQKESAFLKEYVDMGNKPLFAFGHGLSYTTFDYAALKIENAIVTSTKPLQFKVSLKNTGNVVGKEVIQVYFKDDYASITRPAKQLVRFEKVELKAGETKEVSFEIDAKDLAFTGIDMTSITEPGTFQLMVGSSSEDIKLTAKFSFE